MGRHIRPIFGVHFAKAVGIKSHQETQFEKSVVSHNLLEYFDYFLRLSFKIGIFRKVSYRKEKRRRAYGQKI